MRFVEKIFGESHTKPHIDLALERDVRERHDGNAGLPSLELAGAFARNSPRDGVYSSSKVKVHIKNIYMYFGSRRSRTARCRTLSSGGRWA